MPPALPKPQPMPGMLQVARWPDGTKIWRVMTQGAAEDLFDRLMPSNVNRGHLSWERYNYATGNFVMFAVTVPVSSDYEDAPALLFIAGGDSVWPMALWTLEDEPLVKDVLPGLDAKVAWYMIDVLRLPMDAHSSWVPHRLGVPKPVDDHWINLEGNTRRSTRAMDNFKKALAHWEARGRFPETRESENVAAENLGSATTEVLNVMWLDFSEGSSEPLHGPLKYISGHGTTFQTQIDRTSYRFDISLTELHGFRWGFSWSYNSMGRGSLIIPLGMSSEPSPFKALQAHRIVWPASDYEAMLDLWLQPGESRFSPKEFEVYVLLDEKIPPLWAPEAFWHWVLEVSP